MEDKYVFRSIAAGAVAFAVFASVTFYSASKVGIARAELEKARVENEYIIQEENVIENTASERFIELDGQRYFSHIDGRSLDTKLRE